MMNWVKLCWYLSANRRGNLSGAITRALCLSVVWGWLSGCVMPPVQPNANDPRFSPVTPNSLQAPRATNGAIYQEGFATHLWQDQRARRVGDILTITLQEQTTSSKSAQTNVTKESSTELPSPTILGTTPTLDAGKFFPSSDSNLSLTTDYEGSTEFAGNSAADQSNSLAGNITVTVSEVLPNGVLVIRGEKWLTLTQGEEFIRITGLVRPADINPDNTVLSTKIADARITYSGTGELADANRMGWLTRFFSSPYWPL